VLSLRQRVTILAGLNVLAVIASPAPAQRAAPSTPRLVQSVVDGVAKRHPKAIDAAAAWRDVVAGAVRTIDIASPSLADAPGSSVTAVFAAIRDGAQLRGVRVRVLLDAKASLANGTTVADLAAVTGVEMRRITFPAGMDGGYIIADSTRAIAGSQRLDWRSMSENHELGVLFEGRVAERLERLFEHDWRAAAQQAVGRKLEADPARETGAAEVAALLDRGALLAVSPPMGGQIAAIDVLTAVISTARKSLDISIATFSTAHIKPWTELREEITRSSRRGVAVRLIVSDRQLLSKRGLGEVQALSRLPGVEVRLSTLPSRPGGCVPFTRFDNTRLVVADSETVWVGGGAWSHDGFYAGRSVAIAVRSRDFATEASAIFEAAWASKSIRTVRTKMPLPPAPDAECHRAR